MSRSEICSECGRAYSQGCVRTTILPTCDNCISKEKVINSINDGYFSEEIFSIPFTKKETITNRETVLAESLLKAHKDIKILKELLIEAREALRPLGEFMYHPMKPLASVTAERVLSKLDGKPICSDCGSVIGHDFRCKLVGEENYRIDPDIERLLKED